MPSSSLINTLKSKLGISSSSSTTKADGPRSAEEILKELKKYYKPGKVTWDIDPFSSLDQDELEILGKSGLINDPKMFHPNNNNFQISHHHGSRYIAKMARARSAQGATGLVRAGGSKRLSSSDDDNNGDNNDEKKNQNNMPIPMDFYKKTNGN
ncbi:uncharacterized protein L201_007026 [Kwoniella dendrophila CBS 6074]|uniref:Cytoplasmic protein n=1 Tax=Kwoniella dendrophila CBS 6074 TaxID=1295534 RepID=A0AAX4K399_9TREE